MLYVCNIYQHLPYKSPSFALPILDTLHKNKFFAGERRYSHGYQKAS